MSTSLPFPVTALASSSTHILAGAGSSLYTFPTASSSTSDPFSSTFAIRASSTSSSAAPPPLIRQIAISPDGLHAATTSDDKQLRVYSLSSGGSLLSSRTLIKKAADLLFAPDGSIIVVDRVGDVYTYPLEPRAADPSRPAGPLFGIQADPTTNPDADLLLGHVSVLTSAVFSPDGKRIITADRDEHIRVSRYPQAFVIERYLFGSEGFVSAIHIPASSPDTLLSAGGEPVLRLWNWRTGECLEQIDIEAAILPHRRARSQLRKVRGRGKKRGKGDSAKPVTSTAAPGAEAADFLDAPEGWLLPSGQGICIKKITTIMVEGRTVALFFSEGAAALHALPLFPSGPLSTFALEFPVLDFAPLPSDPTRILLSLDTSWGILKRNPPTGKDSAAISSPDLSESTADKMRRHLLVVSVSASGDFSLVEEPIARSMLAALNTPESSTTPGILSRLDLYPLLSIMPRWPGMEEDDDLAGPAAAAGAGESEGNADAPPAAIVGGNASAPAEGPPALSGANGAGGSSGKNKVYTREELSQMNQKQLGRLKSQGHDVEGLIVVPPSKKKRRAKRRKITGGKAVLGGEGEEEDGGEEDGEQAEDGEVAGEDEYVDTEEVMMAGAD